MRRRQFNQGAVSAAVLSLLGCGGGGGGGEAPAVVGVAPPPPGAPPPPVTDAAPAPPAPAPAPTPAEPPPPPVPPGVAMGTNFSGMEWALGGLRSSPRTRHNIDFTVPRVALVREMAMNRFGRNRLPIQWEMLQPMLVDTVADARARSLIGEPGAFDERYARFIDRVFDAHAAVGARCILDLHNYCRYKDFRFQPDGSVIGLRAAEPPALYAWTDDPAQVFTRIFATAPGATLRPAAFADVWSRAARRWKDHPGFGGYGLMNEPHDMPRVGEVTDSSDTESVGQDLMIWPTFAQAVIGAIRAIDPAGPIYLSGNSWGGAMNIGPEHNPAWPLAGVENLIYEVHAYVDAFNNGNGFDWDLELAKGFTAGEGPVPMSMDTGLRRMRIATDWASRHGTRLALCETGMPVDDPRFHEAFRRMAEHTWRHGIEIQTWIGGSHWAARHAGINHVPAWHQHRTQEPLVGGMLKAIAGIGQAVLFDDGPGGSASGPVTITVHARGHLASPLPLRVRSDSGGRFSKTALLIPAGANGRDSYEFTPEPGQVAILSYEGAAQLPPPRRVYGLVDPVAHAAESLADAAMAILARYDASLWNLADAWTDGVQGRPADDGDPVRAVADSGFGSRVGSPMEMVNTLNQDGPDMGPWRPPVWRIVAGRAGADGADPGCSGLWCRKLVPSSTYPRPVNVQPYGLADPHFVVAVLSAPPGTRDGVVFEASSARGAWHASLALAGGRAQAQWRGPGGAGVTLAGPQPPGQATVWSLRQAPGAQVLRVDSAPVGSASARLEVAPFEFLRIGWGLLQLEPRPGFGGRVHGLATGRGSPSDAELAVLERHLLASAGLPRG
ncbi:cellulase family glycosylhydrolase [Ramlibacter sp. AW1]|uniref:Cellulase family glycosylhydrolase n=1 Tax=Ramlibacter aurantiacus TaxID=2801330 RepID=A0A936ZSG6_9BURK|nr:cellulase family glycosylhydrolase [Ramlibacter aurantiacus]MBL0421736.1 cellulase family glycosylhydrolase [Ramlibacter aurantiacus]